MSIVEGGMIDGDKREILEGISDNLTIDEIGFILSHWMKKNKAPILDMAGFCSPEMAEECDSSCFKLHAEVGCTFDEEGDEE